ncbi:hypothetical protein ACEWY4_016031 [Coilia grayii]|uniref:SH3 domain-containing protein n=1 Tax=Coilia grayii TaxID=363190 RepID=A0ABD1JQK3_9TELE
MSAADETVCKVIMAACCQCVCVRRCLSSSDISPAEYDILWGGNDLDRGNDIMTTGQECEPGEKWSRRNTVSLAKGEHFLPDVVLVFSGKRRSTGGCDAELQEALRTRLRVMESSSQDISSLFKDLSARLLSVHAERDCFILTFKTVEEIWRFSTYLSLGYVARCLENFLCDPSFWLDPALLSDVEICVSLQEEHLATLYLGLLLQEGVFFAKTVRALAREEDEDDEEQLECVCDALLLVRDVGREEFWEGTLLSSGARGLVPASACQPLPYPFYQWFLRKYPCNTSGLPADTPLSQHPMATGICVATVDYEPVDPDELALCEGEELAVEGFLIQGVGLFVGRSLTSGLVGFIHKEHVRPGDLKATNAELQFMSEEEREDLYGLEPALTHSHTHTHLLKQLSSSDISTIYRMDRLDESDFTYIKSQPKPEPEAPSRRQTLDTAPQRQSWTWPRLSLSASQMSIGRSTGGVSFSLDDTFRETEPVEEEEELWEELSEGEEESCEELLRLLDTPTALLEVDVCDASLDWLRRACVCVCTWEEHVCEREGTCVCERTLLRRLECVREAAKQRGRAWALRRVCFLLGRVCERGTRLSQARVYYEEALSVCVSGFADRPLLTALYTHLAALYLHQRQTDKLTHTHTLARASTLMLTQTRLRMSSAHQLQMLHPLMCHALLLGQRALEGRVCFLWLSMLLQLGRQEEALPFLERLQFLIGSQRARACPEAGPDLSWLLSVLYHRRYQPHLALAALSLDSSPPRGLGHALGRLHLYLRSSERQNPPTSTAATPTSIPTQALVFLKQALHIAALEGKHTQHRQLCISLAWVYLHHGVLQEAVLHAEQAVGAGSRLGEEEEFEARALHGWLLVLTGGSEQARAVLSPLLTSLQGSDSPSPRGVVHTLLALSLRRLGNFQEAGSHLCEALRLAKESGHTPNQAIALSNLGCLALGARAVGVAEGFLKRSLHLFPQLGGGAEQEHVQALLWMGRSYSSQGQNHRARLANEMALLIGIHAKNIHSQLVVSKVLSRHYAGELLYAQSIVYYEQCVALARQLHDKRMEGDFLEILGSLYLSINTEKSSRRSLDCTKQSLRICIDLGKRREEAESWLHAGRVYYLLQEDELTDMYLQAAVRTALKVEDPTFSASIYEEAGDVFYKGHRNQLKALPYYRDGSVPFARSCADVLCEFRVLSKVTELLMTHNHHQEALPYALLAVQSSTGTGIRLHERVAYQRLACVYEAVGQCELAENYFLKCVSLGPDLTHPSDARYYARVYTHLANITLHKLKDAFDAAGYYQLALAAAVEADDVECVYVLLMKLAELHASRLPDTHLCHHYTHTAHTLTARLEGLTRTPQLTHTQHTHTQLTHTQLTHTRHTHQDTDQDTLTLQTTQQS